MLDTLYTKEQVKYLGEGVYELPNGATIEGIGISRLLYKKRTKTDKMQRGIDVHTLIENGDRSHPASKAILDWYQQNLFVYRNEIFVASEIDRISLIGYIDTIGYDKKGNLVIIDNKITELPISMVQSKTKWFQQLVSYVLHIYDMTGELATRAIILACSPDGVLTPVELGIRDYSQIQMSIRSIIQTYEPNQNT